MRTGHASMTSGSAWRPIKTSWVAEFFKIPVVYQPGTQMGLHHRPRPIMLSAIVTKTTGERGGRLSEAAIFRSSGHLGLRMAGRARGHLARRQRPELEDGRLPQAGHPACAERHVERQAGAAGRIGWRRCSSRTSRTPMAINGGSGPTTCLRRRPVRPAQLRLPQAQCGACDHRRHSATQWLQQAGVPPFPGDVLLPPRRRTMPTPTG